MKMFHLSSENALVRTEEASKMRGEKHLQEPKKDIQLPSTQVLETIMTWMTKNLHNRI